MLLVVFLQALGVRDKGKARVLVVFLQALGVRDKGKARVSSVCEVVTHAVGFDTCCWRFFCKRWEFAILDQGTQVWKCILKSTIEVNKSS